MRRLEVSILFIVLFLPLFSAREQQVFSLSYPQAQTITPQHYHPWSLLISRIVDTHHCLVLRAPELTQMHKSIKTWGDVLVFNKSPSSLDGIEGFKEYTLEIIGFDKLILWAKANELCSSIDYQYPTGIDSIAEYEVV
jgi:hypothetical protein